MGRAGGYLAGVYITVPLETLGAGPVRHQGEGPPGRPRATPAADVAESVRGVAHPPHGPGTAGSDPGHRKTRRMSRGRTGPMSYHLTLNHRAQRRAISLPIGSSTRPGSRRSVTGLHRTKWRMTPRTSGKTAGRTPPAAWSWRSAPARSIVDLPDRIDIRKVCRAPDANGSGCADRRCRQPLSRPSVLLRKGVVMSD